MEPPGSHWTHQCSPVSGDGELQCSGMGLGWAGGTWMVWALQSDSLSGVVHEASLLLFSCPVMSDSLQPHGLQHTKPPCPLPSPGVYPSSCPLYQWCHPAISSSDALLSFGPQSFLASGTFPVSRLFASGGQNTGASASGWIKDEIIWALEVVTGTDGVLLPPGLRNLKRKKEKDWSLRLKL